MTEAEYLCGRLADMIADASDGEIAAELALAGDYLSSFDDTDAIAA